MTNYKIEWVYGNGKVHSTSANTLEMAESKAESLAKRDNIKHISIQKVETVKIVKDQWY
jgi:hypothetical protein